jgi:branched-chain amino acid transport system substrate-binding protein
MPPAASHWGAIMTALHKVIVLAALVTSGPALAQYTDGVVKIGVLTDMSGVYSEVAGPGSVVAFL